MTDEHVAPQAARIAMVVAFDGTDFDGWQSQKARGERTVQEELQRALGQLLGGETPRVDGAGRTDAGTHALGAVAHADVPRLPQRPRRRLNGLLPADLRVRGVAVVPPSFDARRSAIGKRYEYRLWVADTHCPLQRRFAFHVGTRLDLEAMGVASRHFEGERDFASLQSTGSSVTTSQRHLRSCVLSGEPPDVRLSVEGSGFLRHMVRAMVGSLLEVGRGRRRPEWIAEMLGAKARAAAGANAPAHGLLLHEVFYDEPFASLLRHAVAGEDPAWADGTRAADGAAPGVDT